MPGSTPDRFPGKRFEETLALEDQGTDPVEIGEIQRNGSDLKAKDGAGVFNLRQVGSVPTPGGIGHILISLDGASFSSQCPLIGDGWLVNDSGLLLVTG